MWQMTIHNCALAHNPFVIIHDSERNRILLDAIVHIVANMCLDKHVIAHNSVNLSRWVFLSGFDKSQKCWRLNTIHSNELRKFYACRAHSFFYFDFDSNLSIACLRFPFGDRNAHARIDT